MTKSYLVSCVFEYGLILINIFLNVLNKARFENDGMPVTTMAKCSLIHHQLIPIGVSSGFIWQMSHAKYKQYLAAVPKEAIIASCTSKLKQSTAVSFGLDSIWSSHRAGTRIVLLDILKMNWVDLGQFNAR